MIFNTTFKGEVLADDFCAVLRGFCKIRVNKYYKKYFFSSNHQNRPWRKNILVLTTKINHFKKTEFLTKLRKKFPLGKNINRRTT